MNSRRLTFLGGALLAAVFTAPLSAATYYVSASAGNDANAGTLALPFRTIAKGLTVLGAGHTLLLRGGTYAESINNPLNGSSWTNAVTIASYPSETVTLRPPSTNAGPILYTTGDYQIYDGLILDGALQSAGASWNNGVVLEAAHHVRIQNSEIKDTFSNCFLVYPNSNDNEFINLTVHGCGLRDVNYGPGHNAFYISGDRNLVERSTVYNCQGGIMSWASAAGETADYNVFRRNVVYDIGIPGTNRSIGIGLANGTGGLVHSNIIYRNNKGIYVLVSAFSAKVYNNTVYNNWGFGIGVDNSSPGASLRNNIAVQNENGQNFAFPTGTLLGTNLCPNASHCSITTDPQLTNPSLNDFRLQSNSPAIDKGINLFTEGVTTDFTGTARPTSGAFEIGAYEFGGTGSPPPPPPPPTGASTYYVATTGNDANSCTQAKNPATPKRNITNLSAAAGGLSCLASGDTLVLKAGTYNERYFNLEAGQANIPGGPSVSARTKIKGEGVGVTIWKPAGSFGILTKDGGDFIEWSDFSLDCSNESDPSACFKEFRQDGGSTDGWFIHDIKVMNSFDSSIYIDYGSRSWLLEDVEVADCGRGGNGCNFIYGQGRDMIFRRIKAYFTSTAKRAASNTVSGSTTGGIRLSCNPTTYQPCGDNIIEDSWVKWGGHSGIIIGGGGSGSGAGIARNNIVIDSLTGIQTYTVQNNSKIYNNTVIGSTPGACGTGIMVSAGASNTSVKNNIMFNCAAATSDSGTGSVFSTNLTTNPQFINLAGEDFHLQSVSPAINAGLNLSPDVTKDFEGTLRPQGTAYDIGADEYSGSVSPPPPPPPPPPTGTTVSVDSSYSGYSTTPIDDGVINAAGGTSSTWASADSASDHWIALNFGSSRSINYARIHWGFNASQNKYMTSQQVQVQSWNGSSFQTVATLTRPGNDVTANEVVFSTVTTAQLRFYQPANQGNPSYAGIFWVTEVDYGSGAASANRCDLNVSGGPDAPDLQLLTNQILTGSTNAVYDINRDSLVNAVDLQILGNVVLGVTACP